MIVAGLFGGPIIDRIGHKRASVIADLASGAITALIPLLYHTVGLAFGQLLILVFCRYLFNGPGDTARQSLRPDLAMLANFRLEQANAVSLSIQNFATLLGPALAGGLIVALGTSNALWFDSASFLVSAALVAIGVPQTGANSATVRHDIKGEFLEGWSFIWRHRTMRALLLTSTMGNLLGPPFFAVVLPVYAARMFGSAVDLGLMLAAFGGGMLAGSVLFGIIGPHLPRRATYASAFFFAGILLYPLLWTSMLALTVGILVLRGIVFAPINIILVTLIGLTQLTGYRVD